MVSVNKEIFGATEQNIFLKKFVLLLKETFLS